MRRLRKHPKTPRPYGLRFELEAYGNVSWKRIESYENGRDAAEHLRRITEAGAVPGEYRIIRVQSWKDDRVVVAKAYVPWLSEGESA